MRSLFLIVVLTQLASRSFAQSSTPFMSKPPIDDKVYNWWPEIRDTKISGDGALVTYTVNSDRDGSTLIIQSLDKSWRKELKGAHNATVTNDNKFIIFNFLTDSIGVINSKNGNLQAVTRVTSFKTPKRGSTPWLAYTAGGTVTQLILRNLATEKEIGYEQVTDYLFSPDGTTLLLQTLNIKGKDTLLETFWVDLPTGKTRNINKSKYRASDFVFDQEGFQVAFTSENYSGNVLMYYKIGMKEATMVAGQAIPGLPPDMEIARGKTNFSRNGKKLFFAIKRLPGNSRASDDSVAQVDLWSYLDHHLQSQQLKSLRYESDRTFRAVINIGTNKIIRLEQADDDWTTFETADDGNGEYVLFRTKFDWSQENWNPAVRRSIFLISTVNGSRITVTDKRLLGFNGKLYSPEGNYVIWYDQEQNAYLAYNLNSKTIKNISQKVPQPLYNNETDHPQKPMAFGIAAWTEHDKEVLVYDKYDIWSLDPEGLRQPVNVTNGYGRRSQTVFRHLAVSANSWEHSVSVAANEKLLLSALEIENKNNGFFSKQLRSKDDPKKLTMGPYAYNFNFYPMPVFNLSPTVFLKAKRADVYLVTRMNASQYPNLYHSTDLKTFFPVSELHPEKGYNWIISELIHWKTFDNIKAEGILYKPENFDPQKKYPVIFYFYEKDANGLHNYHRPGYCDGQINIPYFVSNGYIVCDPNIYYQVGETCQSVFNSVVSAAQYLGGMPWVDSTKMGIQGHSFGGYEVNCLVGQTSLFKAAASAAGFSNLISMYGSIRSDWGVPGLNMIETGQTGLGTTLWQKPEVFIKNSPLFYADKVTTPLLIMHNEDDGAMPFSQSMEFFNALRRLNKKVWLLQYDESGHQVEGEANVRDYSIRLAQFFNHFLKGEPPAHWLVNSVPANLKGLETGLEIDVEHHRNSTNQ